MPKDIGEPMVVHSRKELAAAVGAVSAGCIEKIEWHHNAGMTPLIIDLRACDERRAEQRIRYIKRNIKSLPKGIK